MATTVKIHDDLDLDKIKRSGQCFRVASTEDGLFRMVSKNKMLLIREIAECEEGIECGKTLEVSCSLDEWEEFWSEYLDLGRNYSAIRKRSLGKSPLIDSAMGFGRGLRILRQDPWEMLITFIISQRKSMPAIATSVEAVCTRFGSAMENEGPTGLFDLANRKAPDKLHAFPTPDQLQSASEGELRECGVGYRAPYIAETSRMVASGEVSLHDAAALSDEALFAELKKFPGVGDKVANCVCLFGYGRSSLVPVDVWIARAISEECDGRNPFEQFGDDAGIMQQYVFHYMTQRDRA